MYLRAMDCCGMRELGSLSQHPDAKEAIKDFGRSAYGINGEADTNDRFRYVVFSQASSTKDGDFAYGQNFATYIQEHKLGEVIEASANSHKNPNTQNYLRTWIWTVNHAGTKRHINSLGGTLGSRLRSIMINVASNG